MIGLGVVEAIQAVLSQSVLGQGQIRQPRGMFGIQLKDPFGRRLRLLQRGKIEALGGVSRLRDVFGDRLGAFDRPGVIHEPGDPGRGDDGHRDDEPQGAQASARRATIEAVGELRTCIRRFQGHPASSARRSPRLGKKPGDIGSLASTRSVANQAFRLWGKGRSLIAGCEHEGRRRSL